MNVSIVQDHSSSSPRTPRSAWPSEEEMLSQYRAQGMHEDEVVRRIEKFREERAKVPELAREFEANFVAMLLEEMKKTVEHDSDFYGGFGEEVFDSMLSMETARNICVAGPGMGLADMIEESLVTKITNKRVAAAVDTDDGLREVGLGTEPATGEGRPFDAVPGTMDRVRNGMALADMKRTYR